MAVKIGTTISGTYQEGPGYTNSSHLIYAVNAGVWWYFTVSSASDTAGNPGTHVLKSFYSSGPDLSTATWTASTDSPNLDASSGAGFGSALFGGPSGISAGGRGLACQYVNNAAGANKDLVICFAALFGTNNAGGGNATSTWDGLIRAVVTANSITWSAWGGWTTGSWNNLADHPIQAGNAIGITTDGYIQVAGCVLHSELDASVATTVDPAVTDTWNTGNISATGNVTVGGATITNLSSQARLEVGMAISDDAGDWDPNRFPPVKTIDSGTQITVVTGTTSTAAATGTNIRWWQPTMGSTRINTVCDATMTNESSVHAFAPLAAGGMLYIYDTGVVAPPNFSDVKSIKANQTQAQGFWPSTQDGTGSKAVFGSAVTVDAQDWCCVAVDTSHIYVARRTAATTIAVRVYSTGGDSWSALGNQPPALTGKTIKAGGGVMGVTNGTDFWLFVIDSTDNAIKYCKFTVALGTWGVWTLLESVDSTATKLSGAPTASPTGRIGLVYSVTNGGNYDTYVSMLTPPPSIYGYATRPYPFMPGAAHARGAGGSL